MGSNEFRPDRVIWNEKESIVIDYKTGIRKNEHITQVKRYVELLSQINKGDVTGFVWYLNDNEVVEC